MLATKKKKDHKIPVFSDDNSQNLTDCLVFTSSVTLQKYSGSTIMSQLSKTVKQTFYYYIVYFTSFYNLFNEADKTALIHVNLLLEDIGHKVKAANLFLV